MPYVNKIEFIEEPLLLPKSCELVTLTFVNVYVRFTPFGGKSEGFALTESRVTVGMVSPVASAWSNRGLAERTVASTDTFENAERPDWQAAPHENELSAIQPLKDAGDETSPGIPAKLPWAGMSMYSGLPAAAFFAAWTEVLALSAEGDAWLVGSAR